MPLRLVGERDVCVLPDAMAGLVGIGPEEAGRAEVRLFGRRLRVGGILDSERARGLKDLDDERNTLRSAGSPRS